MQPPRNVCVRSRPRMLGFLLALATGWCVPAYGQPPPECLYSVTDLGTLGGSGANAMGLNQLGQAVGWADGTLEAHAFLWTDGAMTDLGTLGVGTYSEAYDVNDLGEVVGWSERNPFDPTTDWHAFLWSGGEMFDLGVLGGAQSLAYAINNSTQIVGRSDVPESFFDDRAFLWDSGVMYDLGSFEGSGTGISGAGDINNASQIIGAASGGISGYAGFLWENDSMEELPPVDGGLFGPVAINDSAQIAAHSYSGNVWRTYFWENGIATYVWNGFANAINGHGHVLGELGLTAPLLWRDGLQFSLNDCLVPSSGWTLIRANDINDAGQIVGYGSRQGFSAHRAFILDPCPAEPQPGQITWDASPTSPLRASRSLTISAVAGRTAACFVENMTAIAVELIELQNPIPANPPCCPPTGFSAYETATCSAAGETNNCVRWVGPPLTIQESQGSLGQGTFLAARLQCTPYYTDWSILGPFTIFGAEIVPSSVYQLASYSASCKGTESTCTNISPSVQTLTRRAGDVAAVFNPPMTSPQPDALDVVALVNKFRNLAGAPSKRAAQLQPNLPELNADINALDIVAVVDSFRGFAYPYSGPCPCPSAVTCNATPCTTPTPCAGGTCVKTCTGGTNAGQPCINSAHCPAGTCGSGFCRDRCGRCNG